MRIRIPTILMIVAVAFVVFASITAISMRNSPVDRIWAEIDRLILIAMGAGVGAFWLTGQLSARIAIGVIMAVSATIIQQFAVLGYQPMPAMLSRGIGILQLAGSIIVIWGIRYHMRHGFDSIDEDGEPLD